MESLAIETCGLERRFNAEVAVQGVNMRVRSGSVYGFLGRNGAGKTTTLRMLLGLLAPTSGSARIHGIDVARDRLRSAALCGALLESHGFYQHLSGIENLDLCRRMLGLPRSAIDRSLEITATAAFARRRVGEYSLGMRQRLGIARALLSSPRVLILDEPTNGLDPDGIQSMRTFLRQLPARAEVTVLMSSHHLAEVELIADDIGILHRGRLVTQGRLEALRAALPRRLRLATNNLTATVALLEQRGLKAEIRRDHVQVHVSEEHDAAALAAELNRALFADGVVAHELTLLPFSLEQLYRSVTAAERATAEVSCI